MPKIDIPDESTLRAVFRDSAADVIAKLEETSGRLIEKACKECSGDYRALFVYARNILSAYTLEMTYARRG